MKMKIIMLIAAILATGINLHSITCLNDIECAFNPSPEKAILSDNMIDGATHFLTAKAHIALMLAEYEKTSNGRMAFDCVTSNSYCDKAILEIKTALDDYASAKTIGEKLGYNPAQVELLRNTSFSNSKNQYNWDIYNTVTAYLQAGDILGIYTKNIENLKTILGILDSIKTKLQSSVQPPVEDYWKLLKTESEATLFGNLATVLGSPIVKEQCPR
ncbi:MAG TPA: hypothetical protein VK469_07960 [Candidatus Kapabacteria bacterium]|nr:hypothetical protein [Candidatus Kapabacteria bacterium]